MIAVVVSVFLLALLWALVLFLHLPVGIAAAATLALALTWAAFLGWRLWKARRAASRIEKELAAQADSQAHAARPDQQGEVEAMRAEFQKAVAALKGSKLGRGGRDALALLPWYMIIGPPGSGKSTALRASGLKFPYLSKRGGVRGVGGTRNCEWWLTNEAVILDTAGRYATEDEDHAEWTSFLDLLRRARPGKPVNGLLVAVSVSDVGGLSEEGAGELGRRMRERVDEVLSRLQVVLPVYLLFTKCDLVPGFVETFADLRKVDRQQVWGFTVPLAETGERTEGFKERFAELVAVAEERALRRMGEERQQQARERIYEFPQQLEALGPQLAGFVEGLFSESVYQDAPILRGVYLTSGTQEGRVVDRVMAAMAQAFGIRPAVAEAEPVLEAKSYFLHDAFAKVIVPDQHIAFRNAAATRRDAVRRWIALGVAGAVALLFLVFPLRAFLLNRELVLSTGAIIDQVASRLGTAPKGAPPLADIEPVRERLDLLVRNAEEGPPLAMRLGMYRGDELIPPVRRLYATATARLLIEPVFRQDVEAMEAFARRLEASDAAPGPEEHARFYDLLKLHLFLTVPRGISEPRLGEAEQAWVARQVAERWAARRDAGAVNAGLIEKNAALFTRLLPDDTTRAMPRHEQLVRRMRLVLSRLPLATLAVERVAAEVDGKGYDVTLASVLGGPSLALRTANGVRVRGAFTRRAYEEVVKERLENPASLVELWVLAGDGPDGQARAEGEVERLRSRYHERYVEEWRAFLDAIQVDSGSVRALAMLQELTRGEPPPHSRLFQAVAYNTRIAGALAKAGDGVVDKVKKALGADGAAGQMATAAASRAGERAERRVGPRQVEQAFAGFVAFGWAEAPAGGGAPRRLPLDDWLEQVAFVRDALQATPDGGDIGPLLGRVSQARTTIQSLIERQEVGWRPRLLALLWPPIEEATRELRDGATDEVARRWCSAVVKPWNDTVGRRYPFTREGEDASLADVADFYRPGGGRLWGFYGESLKSAVPRAGDGFQFGKQLGGTSLRPDLLPFLQHAQEVTTVLFPQGSSEPQVAFSVRVRPTPRIAAVFLEVDGQRIEYRNGPEEWHKLTWPGKSPGASLRVRAADGQEEVLQRDGEWGLFRLLEAGSVKGEPRGLEFSMAFPLQALGASITIDFRPVRSESPFFGSRRGGRRLLEPFRAAGAPPGQIGRSGSACP
jgi:type VI secretion system protein ImpL